MTSSSKLGEPLSAEIELLAVNPGELSTIQAALAADQVYQDQMLEKPASYPYIQIAVGSNSKGQPILKLTSSQPITEAFLDMLIQVDWPTGRLVKEYTLLLDPPGFNSNYVSESAGLPVTGQPQLPSEAPKAAVAPVVEAEKPAASKPAAKKPATPPAAAKPAASAKPGAPVEPAAESDSAADPLTTERGDTLYALARQMKPDNVSVEQMLAALYRTNQDAFDGKNMNRLKVGKIIRMPDQDTLNAISNQQAKKLVAEHNTNWRAYKNALSNVVKNSAASETGGNTQQSAGKIGSAQEKSAPQAPATKDVLKLSAGDEKSAAQTDKAAAKAAAANAAQEEATAKENAIKEEQSRAAALEKQVADMKKLMELKNNALSQAENNAAQATAETKAAESKPETPAAKAAETPAVPVPAEVQPAPAAELAPAVPETPAEPATADATVQPEQPSFMHIMLQRLKNISPLLPWALIALPVLICVWALIRIRRKKEIDTFEDAILTAPATEMQNNTVFGDTQAASGDTSFLTDFSQSGVGGMIDSHDVDPIAEAEVYMAYGRDAQAEEILKDAIQKDPERQELKLKLLEIYQTTNNKAAFESLAGEVYANVGPNDQTWSKVVAMGQKLDPENSLYQMPALDDPAPAATVLEADNAEQGYHFNFEAPALEFESSDKPARSVAEPAVVDDTATESASEPVAETVAEPAAEKFAELQTDFSMPADAALNDEPSQQPEQKDDMLAFTQQSQPEPLPELVAETRPETEPLDSDSVLDVPGDSDFDITQSATAETPAAAPATDSANDAELTPKALDLPSLNLDEALADTDSRRPDRTQTTTGEQTLASDDAVFESLPELSLELGGPNDAAFNATPEEEDALTLEEISLDSSDDDKLGRLPEDSLSSENAFPEISLDLGAKPEDTALEFDGEPEEVNTKLDLIQAYIDMEDIIGAKELIEEVLSEGGERQRQRASELLAKVA